MCVCVCACVFVCWAKKIRLVASTFAHWMKHVLSKHICWCLFYPNTRVLPSTWMCLMGVSTVLPSLQHFTGVKIKSNIVLVPCKLQCSGTRLFKDPTWLSRPAFSDLAPLSLFSASLSKFPQSLPPPPPTPPFFFFWLEVEPSFKNPFFLILPRFQDPLFSDSAPLSKKPSFWFCPCFKTPFFWLF